MTKDEMMRWALHHGWRLEEGCPVAAVTGARLRLVFGETEACVEVDRGGGGIWVPLTKASYAEIMPDGRGNPLGLGLQFLLRLPDERPGADLWRLWTGDRDSRPATTPYF